MKKILLASAFGVLGLVSCTKKPIAQEEALKAEKLAQGKVIFENSCKKCHDLPVPTSFSSVQWVGIMNSMAPKAKLNEEQHQMVYDYIVSVKKQ